MGMSAFYTKHVGKDEEAERFAKVFDTAIENGVRLFNSATFYGPLNEEGYGANLRLIRDILLPRVARGDIELMVKVGMDTRCPVEKTGSSFVNRTDAAGLRADVEYALETLSVDYIDIAVLCRVSDSVPIEESVQTLKQLVDEGKIRHIGLSEASADTIRRAHAVAPIRYIEQEWSLWTRDIEKDIVPVCAELGIGIVAYSPLGRGFFTGTIRDRDSDAMGATDFRRHMQPRFAEGNIEKNVELLRQVEDVAQRVGCTVGQLSLAWLHAKGKRSGVRVVPIPGTTNPKHLLNNLAARDIALTDAVVDEIDAIFAPEAVAGDRYAHMAMTFHGQL